MEAELITKKRWRHFRLFLYLCIFVMGTLSVFICSFLIYIKILGPPSLAIPESTLYYADNGSIFAESNSGEKRYWIQLEDISPYAIHATIAIEDQAFYEHHGFDVKRIGGAILANIQAGGKVQGASTITQQYARNLFLTMEKTWSRKIKELIYALRLEFHYDKNQILEGYLNTINFGHGAYGIEAASQYYFGKSASDLTLAEASILMGIPKGPSIYSPLVNEEKAKARQHLILDAMVRNGFISEEERLQAMNETLTFVGKHPYHQATIAPYFFDVVKRELVETVGLDERLIELGGLKVYTTLNLEQQKLAEAIVQETIDESSEIQIGFAAMDPQTGYVTALIGGRDYKESPFNRVTQAKRQPGSTIKPFLYYAALERGFTPSTQLVSEPTTFLYDDGHSKYAPRNFNQRYANKEITLAQALAVSDNIYAVKTHLFLGQDVLVSTLKDFGFQSKMAKVPSLALGTSEVKPLELLNGYGMIANGGKEIQPIFIKKVEDRNGKVLYEAKVSNEQKFNRNLTFILSHMMTGMFDTKLNGYATVTGATIRKYMTREYAGKSGSTNTDYWMAGFTPGLVSVVWTGYDDNREITLYKDKAYAKEVWVHFMESALKGEPEKKHSFLPPVGLEAIPIDPETGKRATQFCPVFRLTYFERGTGPEDYCIEHFLHM